MTDSVKLRQFITMLHHHERIKDMPATGRVTLYVPSSKQLSDVSTMIA